MKRIYVAGPYSADNVMDVFRNMAHGTRACAKILKEGNAPFCPWLDFLFVYFQPSLHVKEMQAYSMKWLEVCDEVYVLLNGDRSKGVRAEVQRAVELGKPVTFEWPMDRLEDYLEKKKQ